MENKYSKKYIIETGMGLQDVDHLKNSSYFVEKAEEYIKGKISLEELEKIIDSYYKNKPKEEERTEEADIQRINILKDWKNYLEKENTEYTNTEKLIIY